MRHKNDHTCGPFGPQEPVDPAVLERARNRPYPEDFIRHSAALALRAQQRALEGDKSAEGDPRRVKSDDPQAPKPKKRTRMSKPTVLPPPKRKPAADTVDMTATLRGLSAELDLSGMEED